MTGQQRDPGAGGKGQGPSRGAMIPAGGKSPTPQLGAQLQQLLAQIKAFFSGLFGKKPAPPPKPAPEPFRRSPAPKSPPPMQPEEKAWFDGLPAEEQASYLALPQAQRKLVRADAEGRRRLSSASAPLSQTEESFAQRTSRIVDEILAAFHYVAPKDPQRSLREDAVQIAANLLRASNGNEAVTKTRTMLTLLERPDFTNGLMQQVERELTAMPKPTRRGAPAYAEAFAGLRASLLQHVEKLVYPGLVPGELVRELVDAVMESVDQQPRARRGNKVSKKIAFEGRHIRG